MIAKVPTYLGTGVHWGEDGWLRFPISSLGSGLWQVPAEGGDPEEVTVVDTDRGEYAHSWPQLLPDQRHVLFTIWGGAGGRYRRSRFGHARLAYDRAWWRRRPPSTHGTPRLSA